MGRIISFAAPAYHSASRAASPDSADDERPSFCSASLSPYALSRPSIGLGRGGDDHDSTTSKCSSKRSARSSKHVQFSDAPPAVCEVPHWDRRPWLPTAEDLALQGEDEDELLASEQTSDATSSEDDGDSSVHVELSRGRGGGMVSPTQRSPRSRDGWPQDALPAGLVDLPHAYHATRNHLDDDHDADNDDDQGGPQSCVSPMGRRGSEGGQAGGKRRDANAVLQASLTVRRGSKSRDLTLEAATRWARRLSV